jgi:hypothetical protein
VSTSVNKGRDEEKSRTRIEKNQAHDQLDGKTRKSQNHTFVKIDQQPTNLSHIQNNPFSINLTNLSQKCIIDLLINHLQNTKR